jgi:plastocyanin
VKRPLTVGLIVIMILGLSAVAVAETRVVKATSTNKWNPMHLYIHVGDAVQWRNPSSRVHDLKSTTNNWSYKRLMDPGERAKRTFGKAGFFKYRCLRHSSLVSGVCQGMCGFIHVAHP